jgi:sarcosine oxidase
VIGPGELVDWFGSDGDPGEAEALEAAVRVLLPGIEPVSVTTAPCVVTATPTGLPYIGWVGDGIAVALGGNGSAAKSSDELGRLAASLFGPDGWTDSLEASLFMPRVV